jgi:hypothetical protein
MKSIEATLNLLNSIVEKLRRSCSVDIALGGGFAVIAHGVGRTTADVDFYIYSELILENSAAFFELLKKAVPGNFEVNVVEGSKTPDDPFPYDIVFLSDKAGGYPRIDLIIPRFKWELEGIKASKPLEDIPFPVLPKPYLIAVKLRAGGPKDNYDVIELYGLLSEEEKKKTADLAVLARRDRNLAKLLEKAKPEPEEADDKEQLI